MKFKKRVTVMLDHIADNLVIETDVSDEGGYETLFCDKDEYLDRNEDNYVGVQMKKYKTGLEATIGHRDYIRSFYT